MIDNAVKNGANLLFIAATNTDYGKLKQISNAIPFQVLSTKSNEFAIQPSINVDNLASPILRINGNDDDIKI
jgi:hypothetical protein